jgi:hypothetical protein
VDLGTRFPAMPNEEIVVRNDGGVRNETHSFAFRETCHSEPWSPEGIACEIVVPVDQLVGSTEIYDHKDRGS